MQPWASCGGEQGLHHLAELEAALPDSAGGVWLSQQAAGLSGLDPGRWGWQGARSGRQVLTPTCLSRH